MAASRAGGPRRGARRVYQQGEDPLYIPRGVLLTVGVDHAFAWASSACRPSGEQASSFL